MCSVQFGKRYFSIKTSVLLYSNKCTVTVCDLFNSDKCLKSNVGTWLVQFRHVYCSIQTRVLFNSDKFTVQFRQVYCSIQTSVLYCPVSNPKAGSQAAISHPLLNLIRVAYKVCITRFFYKSWRIPFPSRLTQLKLKKQLIPRILR